MGDDEEYTRQMYAHYVDRTTDFEQPKSRHELAEAVDRLSIDGDYWKRNDFEMKTRMRAQAIIDVHPLLDRINAFTFPALIAASYEQDGTVFAGFGSIHTAWLNMTSFDIGDFYKMALLDGSYDEIRTLVLRLVEVTYTIMETATTQTEIWGLLVELKLTQEIIKTRHSYIEGTKAWEIHFIYTSILSLLGHLHTNRINFNPHKTPPPPPSNAVPFIQMFRTTMKGENGTLRNFETPVRLPFPHLMRAPRPEKDE